MKATELDKICSREMAHKILYPEKYHQNCMDCGQFVKRDRWQQKDDRQERRPLCFDCWDNYDDPRDM